MRYTFYILIIISGLFSCKEKEIQNVQIPQNEKTKQVTQTVQTKQDSIILKENENRKSIHQQEWEEHKIEAIADSV